MELFGTPCRLTMGKNLKNMLTCLFQFLIFNLLFYFNTVNVFDSYIIIQTKNAISRLQFHLQPACGYVIGNLSCHQLLGFRGNSCAKRYLVAQIGRIFPNSGHHARAHQYINCSSCLSASL